MAGSTLTPEYEDAIRKIAAREAERVVVRALAAIAVMGLVLWFVL